ncbi:WXG100 family type VII secretion target [Nocardioides marmotae]|uniref:ESAT-6-like protein n=1 Tax=Nocardioides marmotae TaxID=2663857 RepID=A0A6I3JD64_9ACTN|nr:WXG100 family type VII secretion target [Nocardioides marmotae]MCR6032467.1 WXG100 family type VII secretion target [Gordonia jinghuaiqii]MBC9734246.1 WXG100 family type VII secretion target [Nocardioides marmotae]MTB85348.1 WXG100 family type VII secretion target [Nocardioides marmotae]MTB96116.1 WXG100 family type VII secretion target [Nocardioides marmotae]QKD99805.1 WXG100 family type VII secretion target [Nocardioides marmotae]
MSQGNFGQGEATLSRAAGMVSDAHNDFTTLASRLTDQLSALQGKWVGEGGRAFFTLHQTWSEKQRTIVNALNDFEASLNSTEKLNVTTDQESGGGMANLTSRLG